MTTLVKKAMTHKLITVPAGTTLFEANKLMVEKRIRHLPVLSPSGDILGVISQRDLNTVPESKNLTVELMMSSPVLYVEQTTHLRTAVLKMLQLKVSCLMVCDEDDNAVGIVTTDDLLWHLAHLLSDEPADRSFANTTVDKKTTLGLVVQQLSDMGI